MGNTVMMWGVEHSPDPVVGRELVLEGVVVPQVAAWQVRCIVLRTWDKRLDQVLKKARNCGRFDTVESSYFSSHAVPYPSKARAMRLLTGTVISLLITLTRFPSVLPIPAYISKHTPPGIFSIPTRS